MKVNLFITACLITLTSVNISAQEETINDKYPHPKGNLLLSENQIRFNYIKDSEVRTDTMLIYNNWENEMTFSFKDEPEWLRCRVEPSPLPAGTEGKLIVTYDAPLRNDYGFAGHNLGIHTNDQTMPIKTLYINAYIEEDFSGLTDEERENPPRIVFKEDEYDFGTVQAGAKIRHSFEFTNEGKRDLIIRKTKASCGCTASNPQKTLLKPGESSTIDVVFDTRGRKGKQHKTVFVISNDFRHHNYALRIVGTIE